MKNKQQPGRTYTQCLAQQQQQQQKQTTNHKLFCKTYKPPNYTETLQSAAQVTQALTSGGITRVLGMRQCSNLNVFGSLKGGKNFS